LCWELLADVFNFNVAQSDIFESKRKGNPGTCQKLQPKCRRVAGHCSDECLSLANLYVRVVPASEPRLLSDSNGMDLCEGEKGTQAVRVDFLTTCLRLLSHGELKLPLVVSVLTRAFSSAATSSRSNAGKFYFAKGAIVTACNFASSLQNP